MDFNAYVESLKEATKGNMIKIAFVSGIVAAVLGLAPLVISWFVCLRFFVWVFAIVALVAAVLAVVQKEDYNKEIVKFGAGVVLAIVAILVPNIFKVSYYSAVSKYGISLITDVAESVDADQFIKIKEKVK